jgi:AcrR family transcriptional regulator
VGEGAKFFDVPSENLSHATIDAGSEGGDRRARKRAARAEHLLELAFDLLEAGGLDAVTMAALADAADYAPASLYTYFESRSALLAAMQRQALVTLEQAAEEYLAAWDAALDGLDAAPPARVAALARLWGFSDLFIGAPGHFPREFVLQQQLLVSDAQDVVDAATVVPAAMGVLDVPRRLLAAAVDAGALLPHRSVVDPLEVPVDGALMRTISWVVALNGALLAEGLTTGLPTTGASLARELTHSLLLGWGADPAELDTARDLADSWAA